MGKGKGSPEYYACRVKPGRIIFEVDGISEEVAREAFETALADGLSPEQAMAAAAEAAGIPLQHEAFGPVAHAGPVLHVVQVGHVGHEFFQHVNQSVNFAI